MQTNKTLITLHLPDTFFLGPVQTVRRRHHRFIVPIPLTAAWQQRKALAPD
ncbi:hypothetical protein [Accumulibacter sp.]|uniref:hypothetical protein n=1 Tax=Accumulibacter sp. TaxID=2053492 RepID=UPI0028C4BF29|nr:hypothetical protein [Accumulibacter sp.]